MEWNGMEHGMGWNMEWDGTWNGMEHGMEWNVE